MATAIVTTGAPKRPLGVRSPQLKRLSGENGGEALGLKGAPESDGLVQMKCNRLIEPS